MTFRLIAAVDNNFGIGYKNKLLYNLKGDMKWFKERTTGNAVIMGRKTYDSIPGGVLKNRSNFVISKTLPVSKEYTLYSSVENVLLGIQKHPDVKSKKIYVIGGAEIYKQMLPHANYIELTVVNSTKKADTFFPELYDHIWECESSTDFIQEGDLEYRHIIYKRKKPL